MRKMTTRIFMVVLLASVVCVIGIMFLAGQLNVITDSYETILHSYVKNQDNMSEINENMYHMDALLWEHILAAEPEAYDKCENEIQTLKTKIEELIRDLENGLNSGEDKELLHQVFQSYTGFKTHIDVVYQLSREDSKQTAQYYIVTNMTEYLYKVSSNLEKMDESVQSQYDIAYENLQSAVYAVNFSKAVCIFVVACIMVLCASVVFFNNRKIISHQTDELKSHQQKIMEMQYQIIVGMANLIESRDGETGEHVKRTGLLVDMIAKELAKNSAYSSRINEEFLENLWKAAPLHDIGKIKVKDSVLQKPGKLTPEEFELIKFHAVAGGQIIRDTLGGIEEKEYLDMAYDVASFHHEKWDGSGYPEGRKGEEIPLCARIMAVADVFDALVSKRCYKEPMSIDKAYEIIQESSGFHFDPVIVDAFVHIRPQVEKVWDREKKEGM